MQAKHEAGGSRAVRSGADHRSEAQKTSRVLKKWILDHEVYLLTFGCLYEAG